ncbi:hypothetical protein ACS0TY_011933 [Phlomoides rotata]
MIALALGLENSKKPFIWVIRTPTGFNLKTESKFLPDGFEERFAQNNQGLVVHGWAPQLEILCHRSTGAFLSHCGWNSTVESLSQVGADGLAAVTDGLAVVTDLKAATVMWRRWQGASMVGE